MSNGKKIFLLPLLFYLATKLEAVLGGGGSDLRTSHDFEDVIYLFRNCQSLSSQYKTAPQDLKEYIKETLKTLSQYSVFEEAVYCAMPYGEEDSSDEIVEKILVLIKLE